eukprot:s4382_g1.t1
MTTAAVIVMDLAKDNHVNLNWQICAEGWGMLWDVRTKEGSGGSGWISGKVRRSEHDMQTTVQSSDIELCWGAASADPRTPQMLIFCLLTVAAAPNVRYNFVKRALGDAKELYDKSDSVAFGGNLELGEGAQGSLSTCKSYAPRNCRGSLQDLELAVWIQPGLDIRHYSLQAERPQTPKATMESRLHQLPLLITLLQDPEFRSLQMAEG